MSYYVTYSFKGYDFDFTGPGDGILLKPTRVNFDDPDFIEGLKLACEAQPAVDAIHTLLHDTPYYKSPMTTDIDAATTILAYAEIITGCHLIEVPDAVKRLIGWADETKRKQSEKGVHHPRLIPGYVYLIQSSTGFYKIGRTTNPDDRAKTFNVKLPFEVEFTCIISTNDMYGMESQLHRRFADKRVNGEWFNLSAEDVQYIQSLAGEQ